MNKDARDTQDATQGKLTEAGLVELEESQLDEVTGAGRKVRFIKFDGVEGESTNSDHKG